MKSRLLRISMPMLLLTAWASAAHAGVHIDLGLGLLPPPVYVPPPPVYTAPPPPVYYGPTVVYPDPEWDYGGFGGWGGHWDGDHWDHEHWDRDWHRRGDWGDRHWQR